MFTPTYKPLNGNDLDRWLTTPPQMESWKEEKLEEAQLALGHEMEKAIGKALNVLTDYASEFLEASSSDAQEIDLEALLWEALTGVFEKDIRYIQGRVESYGEAETWEPRFYKVQNRRGK